MFFGDDVPIIFQSGLRLWTLAFIINLSLFVLFASAVFSIADEIKAFSLPRRLPDHEITSMTGQYAHRDFIRALSSPRSRLQQCKQQRPQCMRGKVVE